MSRRQISTSSRSRVFGGTILSFRMVLGHQYLALLDGTTTAIFCQRVVTCLARMIELEHLGGNL